MLLKQYANIKKVTEKLRTHAVKRINHLKGYDLKQ